MCLDQARASGDGTLIDVHVGLGSVRDSVFGLIRLQYDLLKGWANYLVNNTLTPTKQWVFLILHYVPGDRQFFLEPTRILNNRATPLI